MDSHPERTERRLAAILAADVAGYSRLVGADEEGTLTRLRTLRRELADPAIAAHKGRIVKTTGDGLLVEFHSVVDALRCAVDVQQKMAEQNAALAPEERIQFRVGIHQGDIVVEDGDIFGDGVNIAARLEAVAEPGGICVSARVQEDSAGRLDLAFEDLGEPDLKNIARKVRVYRVRWASAPDRPAAASDPPALALPDKPSIAVLPFANMSSDPEQEFLADGIAEDVITALSRYPSLFVIARNSCFTYKGRAVDVKQVGRELGVRYVLEGSLRKAGNRIRVTAQLVEAETGNHVWAERYDRNLADIFAVQDEITEAVTIASVPAVAQAEVQRAMRKPPESLDAWAAYQQGLWHLERTSVPEVQRATQLFQRAIDLDPNFAGGYVGLAMARTCSTVGFASGGLAEAVQSAESLARQAISLDTANAEAHAALAQALIFRGDLDGALAEAQRALALCPNLASVQGRAGHVLVHSGHRREGLAALEKAVRLDPCSEGSWSALLMIAIGRYYCRQYAEAADAADRAIRTYPEGPLSYRWLAAALGQLGQPGAKAALDKAIAISRASFDMYVRTRMPWMRPEDHEHMLDGLRKAGWEG